MSLTPFLTAPTAIQIHVCCALLALILGPFALFARRRGTLHRSLGYVWVTAMVATALSSFWIGAFGVIGRFGPLHLLAALALVSVAQAVRYARQRRFVEHEAVMRSLYFYAIVVTGLFTLLPGRRINRILFPDLPEAGLVAIGAGAGAIMLHMLRRRRAAA